MPAGRLKDDASRPRTSLFFAGSIVLLLLVASVALSTGAVAIPARQIVAILASGVGFALPSDVSPQSASVLLAVRTPRIVLGIVAGSGLAAAGAVLQAVFRNPLADPMLIGVSSGAALTVTGAIVLGSLVGAAWTPAGPLVLPLAGFIGGLVSTSVLVRLSTVEGTTSLTTMLLAGIAINALAFSGIGLFTTIATNEQLRTIAFWNFGSLSGSDPDLVIVVAVAVAASGVILLRLAPGLNALALGETEARHLGFDTQRLKRVTIACAALIAGCVVAACGVIGFVALVAPHVVRLICGPDHRIVIPGAALVGATLLLAADLVGRTVVAPAELPIGIVTALVGAPFFLWLLRRRRSVLS